MEEKQAGSAPHPKPHPKPQPKRGAPSAGNPQLCLGDPQKLLSARDIWVYLGGIWGVGLQCILRAPQILQPLGCGVRKSSSSGLKSLRAGTRGSHSSTIRLPRWAFHQNIDARSFKRANTRAFRLPFPRGTSCPSALRGWGDAGSVRGHLVTPQAPSPAGTWRGHAFNSNKLSSLLLYPAVCSQH